MKRRSFTENPDAWVMASRQASSYDEYNPFKGFKRRPTPWRKKLLYAALTVVILGLLCLLKKG